MMPDETLEEAVGYYEGKFPKTETEAKEEATPDCYSSEEVAGLRVFKVIAESVSP